ncbi:MAG TPA: hypothetical protein PKI66_03380 [Methanobacteriaceae archaeon]|jgi:hypothetical protein|nr:hypothetical protein [Euryarchaeota archaeon]HNR25741.1 hypothetical protein [Methanobacteriaceae archaeon]HNS25025.1 hypothetical protein [Methanobacteriaceae archaeon]
MPILITNIKNNLINEAIKHVQAEMVILILNKELQADIHIPHRIEYLDALDPEKSAQIRDILDHALEEGEVELALEADAMGLQILESAKNYEIFKKKNILIAKNGKLDTFLACLC